MLSPFLRRLVRTLAPAETDPKRASPDEPAAESPVPPARRADHSPAVLAYVGDAAYELYVRLHLVERLGRSRDLQNAAVALVRASAQSRLLGVLEPELTEEERAIVRRGRNAGAGQVPRSASMIDYRRATAFECLLGHLLLTGQEERLLWLLDRALAEPPEEPASEQE
jgi:ribonuclease-3 family protein